MNKKTLSQKPRERDVFKKELVVRIKYNTLVISGPDENNFRGMVRLGARLQLNED
jgi:hypothetical protein